MQRKGCSRSLFLRPLPSEQLQLIAAVRALLLLSPMKLLVLILEDGDKAPYPSRFGDCEQFLELNLLCPNRHLRVTSAPSQRQKMLVSDCTLNEAPSSFVTQTRIPERYTQRTKANREIPERLRQAVACGFNKSFLHGPELKKASLAS
jgi:hypothetical protein